MPIDTNDKRCPFCNSKPVSIHDLYPEANDDTVSCHKSGCPAGAVWVSKQIWNERNGPEMAALREIARAVGVPSYKSLKSPGKVVMAVYECLEDERLMW